MKIAIFGLGYVGCVGMGCLAELGHQVIGVDIDKHKLELINNGMATIVENKIDEIVRRNYAAGKISATANYVSAIENTDVAIVCVGTPNDSNGHLDMSGILKVAKEIGYALRKKNGFYCIAVRSTVMPGTNSQIVKLIEEISGKKHDADFAVVTNPEFLREADAVRDFMSPPYTVLASNSDRGIEIMRKVYEGIDAEVKVCAVGCAEMIKLVSNSFHGLKVAFSNEIGRICKAVGVNSCELMELFSADKMLNISPAYLQPGFAYGGSCLPKDLKALNSIAHDNYVNTTVLPSIEASNQIQIDYVMNKIIQKKVSSIGLYGLAFKAGTDDLRYSPALELTERLLGKGYKIKIYDKNIIVSKLMGKNKDFLYHRIPHIEQLLEENVDSFLKSIELLVVVNKDSELKSIYKKLNGIKMLDLIRIQERNGEMIDYDGICW